MSKKIIYELPLNERMRTILRLEFLFNQTNYSLRGVNSWDSRHTISSLLEIINIISRIDLRNELSKELQHQKKTLEGLASIPDIDIKTLQQTIGRLNNHLYELNTGAIQTDIPNEFLKTIAQRESIPGGTCDFDIPAYHYWLHQPEATRIQSLETWLNQFITYQNSIELITYNLRNSMVFKPKLAKEGFYQQSLDSKAAFQLIRVAVPTDAPYYAELSGGKHRFSLRFMQHNTQNKPEAYLQDTEFLLACCVL